MKHKRTVLGLLVIAILCTAVLTGCSAPVSEIENLEMGVGTAALDYMDTQTIPEWDGYVFDKALSVVDSVVNEKDKDWTAKGVAILKDKETLTQAYQAEFSFTMTSIDYIGMNTPTFRLGEAKFGAPSFSCDLMEAAAAAKEALFPEELKDTKWGDVKLVAGSQDYEAPVLSAEKGRTDDWILTGKAQAIDPASGEACPVTFKQTMLLYRDPDTKEFPLFGLYRELEPKESDRIRFEIVPVIDDEKMPAFVTEAALEAILDPEKTPEEWSEYSYTRDSIQLETPSCDEHGKWTAAGNVELEKDGETVTVPVSAEFEVTDYADLKTPVLTLKKLAADPIGTDSEE